MGKFDDLKKLKDSAAAAAALAKEHADKVEQIKDIANSAADEAKLRNKKGKVSKWRLAKAAVRPTTTTKRLVKGATDAGKEAGLSGLLPAAGAAAGGISQMGGMSQMGMGGGSQNDIASAMMAFQGQAAALLAQRKEELAASGLGFSPELEQEIAASAIAHPVPPGRDPGAPATAEDIAMAQEVAAKALSAQYPPHGFPAGDPRIAPAHGLSFPTFAIAARAIGWSTDRAFIERVVTALGVSLDTWDRGSEEFGRRMQDDVVVAAFYGQLFSQA